MNGQATPKSKMMILSPETLLGLMITSKVMVPNTPFSHIVDFFCVYNGIIYWIGGVYFHSIMFKCFPVNVFPSQRICQDPLEIFLDVIVNVGEHIKTPMYSNFKRICKPSVVNSFARGPGKCNYRGFSVDDTVDFKKENRPLRKRTQSKHNSL